MDEKTQKLLDSLPDELLKGLSFSVPWQYSPDSSKVYEEDSDGFPEFECDLVDREEIRRECRRKFDRNPQINTAIRGIQGRLTGLGFGCSSGNFDIQQVIDEEWFDYRNRLYNFMPKYVARSQIEGELFNLFTVHPDGFVEVDFISPSVVAGGEDNIGIIYHPSKSTMPLFYNLRVEGANPLGNGFSYQVPSIYVAHNPRLVLDAKTHKDFTLKAQTPFCKSRKAVYRNLGGYYRFIVGWDRGLIERRTVSYLRTVLEWINQYELLKKYEIDHKRSAGSYLWVFTMEDPASFKLWLALSDDDRRKTGIMAKKTPGGSLVLPPGMSVETKNPSLPSINEQDTDILKMVGSGLNEEEGVMTGKSTSPYASIKASRGPMSDRISDEISWFQNFLIHDFWGGIFTLKNKVGSFDEFVSIEECVGFTSKQKKNDNEDIEYTHTPIFKTVKKKPQFLIDVSFPASEMLDFENRAKGLMGTKHGPVSETLGIPNKDVASRMGFNSYARSRLNKATEQKMYPKLIYNLDAESLQEKAEAEPPKSKSSKGNDNGGQKSS